MFHFSVPQLDLEPFFLGAEDKGKVWAQRVMPWLSPNWLCDLGQVASFL